MTPRASVTMENEWKTERFPLSGASEEELTDATNQRALGFIELDGLIP